MKKNLIRDGLLLASVLFSMTIASCGNNDSNTEDSKMAAENSNDAKFDSSAMKNDADFLVAAAGINQEEVALGKLAQQNANMSEVKDLGKMLEEDHNKAMTDLQSLAAKKNVTLPMSMSDDANEVYKDLSAKKGKDFDKSYCDKMVDGHKNAIDKFEKEANSDKADPDIKAWASSMLPVLRKHLEHATTCQEHCAKM